MNLARCTEFRRISISVPFVGATLIQIALSEAQLQFNFDTQGHGISVEGGWEFVNEDGEVIDAAKPNWDRTEYRIHVLLGRQVEGWAVHAPDWFELRFGSGLTPRVHDDSRDHESFSIQPGDIYV